MNTIPSIFNQHHINYSILEGKKSSSIKLPLTCIVLRDTEFTQYRSIVLEQLCSKGFERIISVGLKSSMAALNELQSKFSSVDYIEIQDTVTQGEMLNVAVSLVKTEYFLVLQESMCVQSFTFSKSLMEKFIEKDAFCICPLLYSPSHEAVNVKIEPFAKDSNFIFNEYNQFLNDAKTLYPFDLAAFYKTQTFIYLGGFDYTIKSSYWQKIDFFIRSWLWGEKVLLSSAFILNYSNSMPNEERTIDYSYLMFYIKNILPEFFNDHAYIPFSSFFAFKLKNHCGLSESISLFNSAKKWVNENKYRFKTDVKKMIENWER